MPPPVSQLVGLHPEGQVGIDVSEGEHVVWLRGEHDIATVRAVSATLSEAAALHDGAVVVDLSGVDFMGAATVNVLLGYRESLWHEARWLTFRSPSDSARRVLELCGVPVAMPAG